MQWVDKNYPTTCISWANPDLENPFWENFTQKEIFLYRYAIEYFYCIIRIETQLHLVYLQHNCRKVNRIYNYFSQINTDYTGMIVSAICIVHCMALPLVVSFSTIFSETLELVFIALSLLIASYSLATGTLKHKSPLPFVIMGPAIFLLLAGQKWHELESILTPIAGLFLISAHWKNHKMLHSC